VIGCLEPLFLTTNETNLTNIASVMSVTRIEKSKGFRDEAA
jgi:hypothetical protein